MSKTLRWGKRKPSEKQEGDFRVRKSIRVLMLGVKTQGLGQVVGLDGITYPVE